jgi:ribosomal protein S18 acetylase RimI-like enzyme
MTKTEIKEVTQDRGQICNDLLRALPLWFGIEEAIRQYVLDVERMPTLVAYANERAVGFVSLNVHNEWTAEVHVMAIHPNFHRHGIGRDLIKTAEIYLRKSKHQFLSVKTLSPSRPNKEYEMTRKFYFAMGFRPVEEFKTLWGEANPCLLMIKAL